MLLNRHQPMALSLGAPSVGSTAPAALASGSLDTTIRVWQLRGQPGGGKVVVLRGHGGEVKCLAQLRGDRSFLLIPPGLVVCNTCLHRCQPIQPDASHLCKYCDMVRIVCSICSTRAGGRFLT